MCLLLNLAVYIAKACRWHALLLFFRAFECFYSFGFGLLKFGIAIQPSGRLSTAFLCLGGIGLPPTLEKAHTGEFGVFLRFDGSGRFCWCLLTCCFLVIFLFFAEFLCFFC